jgi:hypothetical protein
MQLHEVPPHEPSELLTVADPQEGGGRVHAAVEETAVRTAIEMAAAEGLTAGEWARRRFPPISVVLSSQCYRDAVAAVLRTDPWRLPPRMTHQDADAWLELIGIEHDVHFDHLQRHELPPDKYARWVAFVPTDDPDWTHAVAMRGNSPLVASPYPATPNDWICGVVARFPVEATARVQTRWARQTVVEN